MKSQIAKIGIRCAREMRARKSRAGILGEGGHWDKMKSSGRASEFIGIAYRKSNRESLLRCTLAMHAVAVVLQSIAPIVNLAFAVLFGRLKLAVVRA
jgi:hypothetical protein